MKVYTCIKPFRCRGLWVKKNSVWKSVEDNPEEFYLVELYSDTEISRLILPDTDFKQHFEEAKEET